MIDLQRCLPFLSMFVTASMAAHSLVAQQSAGDLAQQSLESLTQTPVQVSTFARRPGTLWNTPAAVYVISREDIEHSSFTSIPELLRMVPGLQVAQLNASTWAISARGFNSIYANKLLVLIDGRTVYSEIFSGVPWDQVDLPLANIERIEVIRGPGAAVWGADAANGVINIITRRARNTPGPFASAETGRVTEDGLIRFGGALGRRSEYSAYVSALNREPLDESTGRRAYDSEDVLRAGGRLDWQKSWADLVIASGDLYGGHIRQLVRPGFAIPLGPNNQDQPSIAGGYLLTRWEHEGKAHDAAFQAYFDDQSRTQLNTYARTRVLNLELQDHVGASSRNDIVWGSEFRFASDRLLPKGATVSRRPIYRNYLADGFIQDDITVVRGRLWLTAASKIQEGTLAGLEIQPSVRLLWTPRSNYAVWGAISRAAVAPAIQDKYIVVPLDLGQSNALPVTGAFVGNPAFKPEIVTAYEAGIRRKAGSHFTVDLSLFLNKSERVQSLSVQSPEFIATPSPHVNINLLVCNGFRARSGGVESSILWNPAHSLSLHTNYTWSAVHTEQSQPGQVSLLDAWNTPQHLLTNSGSWTFAPGWNASTFLSYESKVPGALTLPLGESINSPNSAINAYTRLDLEISRYVHKRVRISASGTNLLTPRHREFSDATGFVVPLFVPRTLSSRVDWSF